MKWTGLYLLGYVILMVALGLALWKTGVLQSRTIGPSLKAAPRRFPPDRS